MPRRSVALFAVLSWPLLTAATGYDPLAESHKRPVTALGLDVDQLSRLASAGNAEAQFKLGQFARQAGYPDMAFKWMRTDAPPDPGLALLWYQRAADQDNAGADVARLPGLAAAQGDAAAEDFLGDMYQRGTGIAQDPATALEWYRKAAKQGQIHAAAALGGRLSDAGQVDEAFTWLTKAARRGCGGAV